MKDLRKGAIEVAQQIRDAGYEAYFAGGSVRDLLLGLTPKDFDLVTDATPQEVDKLFKRTVLVGAQFGVIRVLWSGKREYEIASYRSDGLYTDGRRPNDVEYSKSKEEDVKRRDFTVNALLMDPFTDEVFDYVEGRIDLEAGLIRAVGEADRRFQEDRLRLLRAIRFAARFGFEIEPLTMKAIIGHASHINEVSEERIVTELHGIWMSARPEHGMSLLSKTGLLDALFTDLVHEDHAEVLRRFTTFSDLPSVSDSEDVHALAWALLLDVCSLSNLDATLRRLKLSRSLMKKISSLLTMKPDLLACEQLTSAEKIRTARHPNFQTALRFLEGLRGRDAEVLSSWQKVQDDLKTSPLPKLPLLTGADLSKLGYKPGPIFKKILRGVEDEVFERRVATTQEALDWVKAQDWS